MTDARAVARALRQWAVAQALPLWASAGWDADRGLFHERLHRDGTPDRACPRRAMVQARQIYVFAHAATLGWHPDARERALAGVTALQSRYWARDGAPGYAFSIATDGTLADATRDAYAHAFVLLAIAWAYRASGDAQIIGLVDTLLAFIDAHLTHRDGALHESVPPRLPRRQNPHMHLFEAMLALHECTGHPQALPRARALFALMRSRFLDPETGTLREFFDDDWRPAPGIARDHIEPGHHAEWVWLLHRYRTATGEDTSALADDLFATVRRFADPVNGTLIDEADRFGHVRKASRRLWPQTEAAKAWLAHAEAGDADAAAQAARILAQVHAAYLSGPVPGAWHDQLDADGKAAGAFVPASSLYHLVGAIAEADRVIAQPVIAE
ncbi:MAG: AGE family epimerase/isomerase [Rhizobiales bacterium]|nr:AGE family epimerase/isomerase [Hyphomicrobiales bacterium]